MVYFAMYDFLNQNKSIYVSHSRILSCVEHRISTVALVQDVFAPLSHLIYIQKAATGSMH